MQKPLTRFSDYLRMIKFSHSLFALPFAGVALIEVLYYDPALLANSDFLRIFLGILICMISMRSAAMGFNRIVDRRFDAANPRTASREIPAGTISLSSAMFFVVLFVVIFVASSWWINPLAGLLSPIPIVITLGYSFTKRFTYLCHVILGLALGLVPPAVWISVTGTISIEPVMWMAAVTMYTAGFDILYALQDIDFDRSQGLQSVPARFGMIRAFWIARILHLVSFSAFLGSAIIAGTGWIFILTLGIVGSLFMLQHWLVGNGRLDRIPVAFFHVNASISAVTFFGLLLDRFL